MTNRPRTTATEMRLRCLLRLLRMLMLMLLVMGTGAAWAGPVVGTVVQLSGPLLERKADGTVRVLALKSEVESGGTLVAEKNTYAQLRFIDDSEITLRPGTTFRIDRFAWEAGKPEADSAAFSLLKGGLRSITGLLGKRSKEKYVLKTPSATIGIRGTVFIAQWLETPADGLPAGLHLAVSEGAIVVASAGGTLGFEAGQSGWVPGPQAAPLRVPPNPGLRFAPPPSFGEPGGQAAGGVGREQAGVDCVVR